MSNDGKTGNGLMNRDGSGRKGAPSQGGAQSGSRGADKAQSVADRMQPKPSK